MYSFHIFLQEWKNEWILVLVHIVIILIDSKFLFLLVLFLFRICKLCSCLFFVLHGFWNIVLGFCSCSLFRSLWFSFFALVGFCSTTQPPKFLKICLNVVKSMKKLMKTRVKPRKNSLKYSSLITTNQGIICWKSKKKTEKWKNSCPHSYSCSFKWFLRLLIEVFSSKSSRSGARVCLQEYDLWLVDFYIMHAQVLVGTFFVLFKKWVRL